MRHTDNILLERNLLATLGKSSRFQNLVNRTKRTIITALNKSEKPYISYSGGKDSQVVLHLVRSIDPNVIAMIGYDDFLYPETKEIIENTPNHLKILGKTRHAKFYTAWANGKPDPMPNNSVWFDVINNSRIAPYCKQQNYDCCFMGLRKEEASYRRIHLSKRGDYYFCKYHQYYECNPVAKWTVEDIWTYIMYYQIPYNKAYDKLATMGLGLQFQRVGPMAVDKVVQYGQLTFLRKGWPELYEQFATTHPEVRNYA